MAKSILSDTRPATGALEKPSSRARHVRLRTSGASVERCPDGSLLVRPDEPLGPYPRVLTDRVIEWAKIEPNRICAAKREKNGGWRSLTYSQVYAAVRSIAQALLDRGLSVERPVAILSENDLEHLLLMLAGQHAGIPTAHISPVYSLVSKDLAQLRHCLGLLTPGMVFVSDGEKYQRAIEVAVGDEIELVVASSPPEFRKATRFAELLATNPTKALEAAHERIDPDSPAKFLFTSGSTGMPKAVINTHRMICSNQQMIAQVFGFLEDEPPVLVDWLPWNHTFGGNHNIGIAIHNGGSLYIDEGKPMPGAIERTVRNLREIAPTIYFNVPRGFEALLPFLRQDRALRENFFSRLKVMFYAGASLSQTVWDEIAELSFETCGERIAMLTGLGATETAPSAIFTTPETSRAGAVGVPLPGVEVKLAPVGDKLEGRVRGPNITPGYWREEETTRKAFDEEGYYCFGDALRFLDDADEMKGFRFEGRLSENFKLATGTWVSVGPLRQAFLSAFAPYAKDVVITGHDRDEVCALVFPDVEACRRLCAELPASSGVAEVLRHE